MARSITRGGPSGEAIVSETLTTKQTAQLVGIGERTLWRLSRCGIAPPPIKIGGTVRYRRTEYLNWIAAGCPRADGRAK